MDATSRRRGHSGFTLIELMMAVVIIGILASIGIPRYLDYTRESKQLEAKPMLRQIRTLQERYRIRESSYATEIGQLEGGPTLPSGGRYFTYAVAAHPTGFCAVATPTAAGQEAGLQPQSLDAEGRFHETSAC